jgi:hypothetical protein
VVTPAKLLLLSIGTVGLFQFWWMHQNWMVLRDRFGARVSPFWRAFLAPIFSYTLFARVARVGEAHGLSLAIAPAWLAAGYLLGAFLAQVTIGILAVATAVPLLPANELLAQLNQTLAPDAPPRVGWSVLNVIWLVLFALLLAASTLTAAR